MLHKIDRNKKCAPKLIFSNNFFFQKDSDDFWHLKLTLKNWFWHFLTAIFGHLASLIKKPMSFLWSVQSWLESEMFFIKFYWHREKITIWSSYKASLGYTTLYVRQNWTRIRLLPTLTLLLLLLRCYMCNRVCSSYLLWAYRQQSTSPISSYLGSRSPVGWFRPCLSRQSFFLKVMLILLSILSSLVLCLLIYTLISENQGLFQTVEKF